MTGRPRSTGRRLAWSLAVPAAVALAIGLAGCSSNASTSPSTTTTTGASTTTTSGTSTTTTSSTTTTGTITCQPQQLSASPQNVGGGAGTIELSVSLTNTSTSTCTLAGYPGMQLLSSSGASLPTNVVRGGGQPFTASAANQPPSTVTLAPNAVAAFSLNYEDVPVGSETTCPTSAKAEITPPNDTAFLTVALQIAPCGGGTIHVSPVYATS
jgi:hypothetical protein